MRLLQRVLRRLQPNHLWLVHHPGYAQTIPSIPLDPGRGDRIAAFLREEGLVAPGVRFQVSLPTPIPFLLETHHFPK